MKSKIQIIFLVVIAILIESCASMGVGNNNFKLRPYKEVVFKNGLKVIFLEDNSLPYFSLNLLVKSGSTLDPKNKSGLANLVGELLDKGTSKQKANEIADSFADIGSDLSVGVSSEFTVVKSSTLNIYSQKLIDQFVEIVSQPTFSQSEVTRVKRQITSALQKQVDDPSSFTDRIFQSYLFGDHPYGKSTLGEKKDISRIKRKDIIKFYLTNYRPNNSVLAVVGKFDTDKLMPELEKSFSVWENREIEKVALTQPEQVKGLNIRLIDKKDIVQTQIRIGNIGIERTNPDYLALRVATTILGGAFHSRLMGEIRDRLGLTYSIRSEFDAHLNKGSFEISTFTKNNTVETTLKETLRVYKEFVEKGVTKQEAEDAVAYLKGVFPRSLETAEKLALNLLFNKFYGIPDSYLSNYLSNISKFDAKDINMVIKKHFNPNDLKILVYSSKEKILDQVKKIGEVEVKSYSEFN